METEQNRLPQNVGNLRPGMIIANGMMMSNGGFWSAWHMPDGGCWVNIAPAEKPVVTVLLEEQKRAKERHELLERLPELF